MENLPFRGREARAAGLVTRGILAGPTMRRIFPDVHVPAGALDDLRLRARAAGLLVPDGVVGGYAAAELLGAPCAPYGAAVDLITGPRHARGRPGLTIRQVVLRDDEITEVDGIRVTSLRRTAFDLARQPDHVEAVVALDALAHAGHFDPEELLAYLDDHAGARGIRRLAGVVAAADRRAESPPETRTRLSLIAHGLPAPELQIVVHDHRGIEVGRVDMGWREVKVGVEYQGDHHRVDKVQWRRDQRREGDLAAEGWLIIPATAATQRRPDVLAEQVMKAIFDRSR